MEQKNGQSVSIVLFSAPVILAVAGGLWLERISTIVPQPYLVRLLAGSGIVQ